MSDFKNRKLTILYASQTGNCQDVSERIWRESKSYYFTGPVKPMDEYNITELINEECVIFICSTTGQGEEPDNMKSFWKFLLRKNLPADSLTKINCAVLGLGDSSYVKYNFVAKRLNKRLLQLGANLILPVGLADDQHDLGYDAVVDVWIESLWTKLQEIYPLPNNTLPGNTSSHIEARWKVDIIETNNLISTENNTSIYFSKSLKVPTDTFCVKVKNNIRSTSETHFQDVRLIEFTTNGQYYQPGDVLNVRPHNSKEQIDEFYDILNTNNVHFNPEMVVKISEKNSDMHVPNFLQNEIKFQTLCEQYFDLTSVPRRYVFSVLAQLTKSELEREKCIEFTTAEGQNDLYNYCNRPKRNITEVLRDFPHAVANITIDMLFEIFSPIKSRAFSIASSFQAHTNEVHILVAVVKYKTKLLKERLGLCSNWLADLKVGQEIPVWIKRGSFRFPNDPDASIIMVGPGTGVAPFRNFLCEAEKLEKASAEKLMLFFGCRQKEHDFLCKEDFKRMENNGKLDLICAFSRDQDHKIYVQHKIKESQEKIIELLRNKTYIYVAGNSKNMPDAVREAFAAILSDYKPNEIMYTLDNMEKNGQYQTETWS